MCEKEGLLHQILAVRVIQSALPHYAIHARCITNEQALERLRISSGVGGEQLFVCRFFGGAAGHGGSIQSSISKTGQLTFATPSARTFAAAADVRSITVAKSALS
jgi:hypothetical protein